jgi:hypothetical protein
MVVSDSARLPRRVTLSALGGAAVKPRVFTALTAITGLNAESAESHSQACLCASALSA